MTENNKFSLLNNPLFTTEEAPVVPYQRVIEEPDNPLMNPMGIHRRVR